MAAAGIRAACLERLATALLAYQQLDVKVRTGGPAPCLAVRNTDVPLMSETVAVSENADGPSYVWSWGARIGGTSDVDTAARAIAYVLAVSGAQLRR